MLLKLGLILLIPELYNCKFFAKKNKHVLIKKLFSIPTKCEVALAKTALGIPSKNWAREMIDSIGKLESGILEVSTAYLGSFDECIKIKSGHFKNPIYGKYCLATINVKKKILKENIDISDKLKIFWGICIPDACSAVEFQRKLNFSILKHVSLNEEHCQSYSKLPEITPGDVIALIFFGTILYAMISATIYDFYLDQNNNGNRNESLLAFSVRTNVLKLLEISKSDKKIKCLHGIRVLSSIWIMLYYFIVYKLIIPLDNYVEVYRVIQHRYSMTVIAGTLAVDTFFLVSGTVLSYTNMNFKTLKFAQIPGFYLQRYIRLTTVPAALLVVHVTISKHIGSGPIWPLGYKKLIQNCTENWWSTLLHIQNIVNPGSLRCMEHIWFTDVDMQLFLFAPLILIPLSKFTWQVFLGITISLFSSIAWTFYLIWNRQYHFIDLSDDFSKQIYTATHVRGQPWLLGIILGYILHEYHDINFRIKTKKLRIVFSIFLWILAFIICLSCIYGSHDMIFEERNNKWLNAIHGAIYRPAWTIAIAWIIFACHNGCGGLINTFLSQPIFEILSKLSFSMYLVHQPILLMILFSSRHPIHFTVPNELYTFGAFFLFSLMISIILKLAFEMPVAALTTCLKTNGKPQPTPIEN